jgi:hypothetical protein
MKICQTKFAGSALLALGLLLPASAYGMMVYRHVAVSAAGASTVRSHAMANAHGSDQAVTAYDNFTLTKSAEIKSIAWRGASSDKGLLGFTVKLYASRADPSAQPDTVAPVAELTVEGNAGEKAVGNNLSDYHAEFSQSVPLQGHVQYWVSIVSNRKDLSPWGWANGTGGDGKSMQAYSEFKVLPAPGDRAFMLSDGRAHSRKR